MKRSRANRGRLLVLLLCASFQCVKTFSQQNGPGWLSQLLSTKGTRQEFSVRGRRAVCVTKELADQMNSRDGLRLIYFEIPMQNYELSAFAVGPEGTAASLKKNSAEGTNAIVIVNGGYYGTDDNKTFYPLGLLIHDGLQLNKMKDWNSGGVLYSSNDRSKIVRIKDFHRSADILEALQSKPLLVEDSRSGIHTDDHQLANRTAVGLRRDGAIVVAGAFSPSNNAMTLAEFADFLSTPVIQGGAGVDFALNMDGGPSALIFCPALNLKLASGSDNFIPNGIRISARK
nr:phosphodiester glycosidase family protein [Edaphobacter lichenicola]